MHLTHDNDKFHLYFTFDQFPNHTWFLWFPECAMFDNDEKRALFGDVTPEWTETDEGLLLKGASGDDEGHAIEFSCLFKVVDERLMFGLETTNVGTVGWGDYAQLALCLTMTDAPTFFDEKGERTYLIDADGNLRVLKELLAEVQTGRYRHLPKERYEHHEAYSHFAVAPRHDPDDLLEKCQTTSGFTARQNESGDYTLVFTWDEASRVDINMNQRSCIHSHPCVGPLAPRESLMRKGYIALLKGTAQDALAQGA